MAEAVSRARRIADETRTSGLSGGEPAADLLRLGAAAVPEADVRFGPVDLFGRGGLGVSQEQDTGFLQGDPPGLWARFGNEKILGVPDGRTHVILSRPGRNSPFAALPSR